jgi:hypothetical protein
MNSIYMLYILLYTSVCFLSLARALSLSLLSLSLSLHVAFQSLLLEYPPKKLNFKESLDKKGSSLSRPLRCKNAGAKKEQSFALRLLAIGILS